MEQELEKLLQTDRDFAASSLANGAADAFHAYLHENALMLSAGGTPVQGLESIYERMKNAGEYVLQWTPCAGEVAASGDMGWTWGEFISISGEGGKETRSYGKYLNVWRKDDDGEWKVVVDIGNDSPAPGSGADD